MQRSGSNPARWVGAIAIAVLSVVSVRAAMAPRQAVPPAPAAPATAAPPLTAADALRTFRLPPGYRLELVASEPLVADPVWMDIDPDGRLWVVEMRGFMPNFEGTGEDAPVGQVVVLEDTDDDGRADRRTVFLDGLVQPRTVKVLDGGVLVIAPPQLILARDTNGDLKADTREVLRSDVGVKGGNPEHSPNSLLWGLDNWLHTSEHTADYRWTRTGLETAKTLSRGQWGISMDDTGRVFRNWNDDPLRVDYLPGRILARNPAAVRTRGVYEPVTEDLAVWAARPTPAVNRGYRDGVLRPDGSLAVFQAAGTPTVYRGDRLPADLRGHVFVTEPAGNLVRRYALKEGADGRLAATNAHPRSEFLTSTDERFRPVNLLSAADGTLYIADMYRGVIQHGQYQSEYPEEPDPRPRPGRADRPRAHLSCRARDDATRSASGALGEDAGGAGCRARACERLVARHRTAAAGRTRRSIGRAGAGRAGDGRPRLAHAAARALDARRARRARCRHGAPCARRRRTGRPGGGSAGRRAVARQGRRSGAGGGPRPVR